MPDTRPDIRPDAPSLADVTPLDRTGAPRILWNRIRAAERRATEPRPLVLVVEDRVPDRLLMRYALRDDARTDSATTVDEAVRMGTATRYDAVLVTVRLPGDTGLSVLKHLRFRREYRDVPMVAVTAQALTGDRDRFLSAGFDAYVAKPFELKQLASIVRDLLDDSRRGQPTIPAGSTVRKAS